MKDFIEQTFNMDILSFELMALLVIFIMIIGLAIIVWGIDRENEKLEFMLEKIIDELHGEQNEFKIDNMSIFKVNRKKEK